MIIQALPSPCLSTLVRYPERNRVARGMSWGSAAAVSSPAAAPGTNCLHMPHCFHRVLLTLLGLKLASHVNNYPSEVQRSFLLVLAYPLTFPPLLLQRHLCYC